jgi:hypothetical protein
MQCPGQVRAIKYRRWERVSGAASRIEPRRCTDGAKQGCSGCSGCVWKRTLPLYLQGTAAIHRRLSLPTPACPFPATPFSLPPSPPLRPTPTPILLAYHSTHSCLRVLASSYTSCLALLTPQPPKLRPLRPGGGALRIFRPIPPPCSSPAPLQFLPPLTSTTHPDTAFAALLAATDHPAGTQVVQNCPTARLPLRRLRNLPPSSTEQCAFVDPASQPPPQPRRSPAS